MIRFLLVCLLIGTLTPPPADGCLFGCNSAPPPLFTDLPTPPAHRVRYVRLDASVFMGDIDYGTGLPPGSEITINLFDDTNYVGVVTSFSKDGPNSYAWTGYLKGIEYSSLFIICVDGAYIIHAASPQGVYEVSWLAGDLYRIVHIKQPSER